MLNWVVKLSFPDGKINYCSSLQFILAFPHSVSWGSGEGVWDIPKNAQDDLFTQCTIISPSRKNVFYTCGSWCVCNWLNSALFLQGISANHCGANHSSLCVCVCGFKYILSEKARERITGSASFSQIRSMSLSGAMQFAWEPFPSFETAWKFSHWLTVFCRMGSFVLNNLRIVNSGCLNSTKWTDSNAWCSVWYMGAELKMLCNFSWLSIEFMWFHLPEHFPWSNVCTQAWPCSSMLAWVLYAGYRSTSGVPSGVEISAPKSLLGKPWAGLSCLVGLVPDCWAVLCDWEVFDQVLWA